MGPSKLYRMAIADCCIPSRTITSSVALISETKMPASIERAADPFPLLRRVVQLNTAPSCLLRPRPTCSLQNPENACLLARSTARRSAPCSQERSMLRVASTACSVTEALVTTHAVLCIAAVEGHRRPPDARKLGCVGEDTAGETKKGILYEIVTISCFYIVQTLLFRISLVRNLLNQYPSGTIR